MKPEIGKVLDTTALALIGEIGPTLEPAYRQASAQALGAMLMVARQESDRAAARRVEENQALRALFAEAEGVVEDTGLRERLAAAAATRDESLLVPDLEAGNQALRALLIELHAHVEALSGDAARALDEAIWQELVASTARRQILLASF